MRRGSELAPAEECSTVSRVLILDVSAGLSSPMDFCPSRRWLSSSTRRSVERSGSSDPAPNPYKNTSEPPSTLSHAPRPSNTRKEIMNMLDDQQKVQNVGHGLQKPGGVEQAAPSCFASGREIALQ